MTYLIVGGPQGKFLVVNDLVYGYKGLFPEKDDFLLIDANGVPLNNFLEQIRNTYFTHELLPNILFSVGLISSGFVVVILSLIRPRLKKTRTGLTRVKPAPTRDGNHEPKC